MEAKIAVARAQLGTALSLYLSDKDPISVHSLAAAAAELLAGIGKQANVKTISGHILETNPDMKERVGSAESQALERFQAFVRNR